MILDQEKLISSKNITIYSYTLSIKEENLINNTITIVNNVLPFASSIIESEILLKNNKTETVLVR